MEPELTLGILYPVFLECIYPKVGVPVKTYPLRGKFPFQVSIISEVDKL